MIPLLISIWIVFSLLLLQITIINTLTHMSFGISASISFGKSPRVGLLGLTVNTYIF